MCGGGGNHLITLQSYGIDETDSESEESMSAKVIAERQRAPEGEMFSLKDSIISPTPFTLGEGVVPSPVSADLIAAKEVTLARSLPGLDPDELGGLAHYLAEVDEANGERKASAPADEWAGFAVRGRAKVAV